MNKAGYRMLAWLSVIAGNFLASTGFIINLWVTDMIHRGELSNPSASSSIYTYISLLVFVGIILFVIGIGFIWRSHQSKLTTPS